MAFNFKLVTVDGTPADSPTFKTAAPRWRPGDTIPLGYKTLCVVDVPNGKPDEEPGAGRRGHGRMRRLARPSHGA
jgi:hypothetical protein